MKKILFKVKATNETDGLYIEGWAVKYGVVDSTPYKDKLLYGCCTKTLQESKKNIKLLFEHDRTRVIGKITNFEDSFDGLYIKAKISEAESEIKTKLQEGLYDSFSIGFVEIKSTPIFTNGEFTENQITEIALKEVSLVSFPAYKQAKFEVVKSLEEIIQNEELTETEIITKLKSLTTSHSQEPEGEPITFDKFIQNFTIN